MLAALPMLRLAFENLALELGRYFCGVDFGAGSGATVVTIWRDGKIIFDAGGRQRGHGWQTAFAEELAQFTHYGERKRQA